MFGRTLVSALNGRKSEGRRASGRMGGWDERDVWIYDSSAGESCVVEELEVGIALVRNSPQDGRNEWWWCYC